MIDGFLGAIAGYFDVNLYRLGYNAALRDAAQAVEKLKKKVRK